MPTLLSGNLLSLSQQSNETAPTQWVAGSNTTIVLDTVQAYDDTQSLRVTSPASGGSQFTTGTGANAISGGIVTGQAHTASVRVYSSIARNIRAIVTYFNGGTTLSSDSLVIGTTAPGTFTYVSLNTFTPPASTNKIEVVFRVAGTAASEQHWFDQMYFGVPNQPPTVDVGGDQAAQPEDVVTLTASVDDPENNTPYSYLWETAASYEGPDITFATPDEATTTFIVPSTPIDYQIPIKLTVQDSFGAEGTDTMVVTVGEIALLEGNLLSLNQQTAEGSLEWNDASNGTILLDSTHAQHGVYATKLTAIADGAAQFSSGTGIHAITTGVVGGRAYIVAAQVYATAVHPIRALVNYYIDSSFISQTNVVIGNSVSGSFVALSYELPAVPSGANKIEVNFILGGASAGEAAWFDQLYYGYVNNPPEVNAGLDIATAPNQEVAITAAVTDTEGDTPYVYLWEVASEYGGPAITLQDADTDTVRFTPSAQLDDYQVPLTISVTDAAGKSNSDSVVVSVYAGPWVWKRESGTWVKRKLYRRVGGSWEWA